MEKKNEEQLRQDKEFLAWFFWGFGRTEKEKYYFYVSLLLIETGMDLQDLLQLTIKEAESQRFKARFPQLDLYLINQLKKRAEKKKCQFLLSARCRKSYIYFFRKILRRGRGEKDMRVIPRLKKR